MTPFLCNLSISALACHNVERDIQKKHPSLEKVHGTDNHPGKKPLTRKRSFLTADVLILPWPGALYLPPG